MALATQDSKKKSRMSLKKYNIPAPVLGSGIFMVVFLLTLFTSSSFTPVQPSNAEDVAAVLNSSGYFLNLTSGNGGVVAIDVLGTAAGAVGLARDTINIKSNAPDGYDLYLGMDNKNVDGNRLYKDGDSTSSSYLSPTSGTFSAPAVLDTNSWGYALANTTPGLPTEGANFNAAYNPAIPDDASLWASVPLAGNEQLIQTITTPNPTDGINTDIYYGAKANVSLPSGSYKGTITYTAIAKTNSSVNEYTSVSPAVTTKLEGGEILTIATMLSVDASQAEDPGDPSQGIPAKKVSVTVGGQSCPVTNLSNAQNGSLVITCTAPSMATGRYDVGVDVPKYDKFWVIVNGIQYKYTTQDQDQAIDQVTGGDATANDILLDKKAFVGGTELTGTMPNNGAISQTIGIGDTYTIPMGFHNGQGKVSFSDTPGTATATSTAATGSQTLNLNAPGYYDKVTVDQTNAYNAGYNAGASAVSMSGSGRLGKSSYGGVVDLTWSKAVTFTLVGKYISASGTFWVNGTSYNMASLSNGQTWSGVTSVRLGNNNTGEIAYSWSL